MKSYVKEATQDSISLSKIEIYVSCASELLNYAQAPILHLKILIAIDEDNLIYWENGIGVWFAIVTNCI